MHPAGAVDAYDNHLNQRDCFQLATPGMSLHFLKEHCPATFDPAVVSAVTACVSEAPHMCREETQVDVRPDDLREGMTLARDLWTRSHVLLLPKGTRLCAEHLACIRQPRAEDPIGGGVYVYRKTPPGPQTLHQTWR